eukprot:702093-Alexandrium_andersonii.AAC.1
MRRGWDGWRGAGLGSRAEGMGRNKEARPGATVTAVISGRATRHVRLRHVTAACYSGVYATAAAASASVLMLASGLGVVGLGVVAYPRARGMADFKDF